MVRRVHAAPGFPLHRVAPRAAPYKSPAADNRHAFAGSESQVQGRDARALVPPHCEALTSTCMVPELSWSCRSNARRAAAITSSESVALHDDISRDMLPRPSKPEGKHPPRPPLPPLRGTNGWVVEARERQHRTSSQKFGQSRLFFKT